MKDLSQISNAPLHAVPADVWFAVFSAYYVANMTLDKEFHARLEIARDAWRLADDAVEDLATLRKERG